MTKTYEQYKNERQAEFNALPIKWAYSQEQFVKAMEELGVTEKDIDKIYKIGSNGFYLRSDSDKIKAFINRPDPLKELMKDYDFMVDAFYYELCNHEYAYNTYQGDWDTCSCFGDCEYKEYKTYKDYLTEMGYGEDTIRAYKEAVNKYYRACDENGWW